ncbi:MAG: DUF6265 family protein [Phycisphaerales bacterium]
MRSNSLAEKAGAWMVKSLACVALAGCAGQIDTRRDPEMFMRDAALDRAGFLAGTWRSASEGSIIEEHWSEPAGDGMIGYSRTIKPETATGGRLAQFEFLRLSAKAGPEGADAGELTYIAAPGGRYPPTAFTMTGSAPGRLIFENPAHDFPQKIEYWLDEAGALHARISAPGADGGEAAHEWVYQRVR